MTINDLPKTRHFFEWRVFLALKPGRTPTFGRFKDRSRKVTRTKACGNANEKAPSGVGLNRLLIIDLADHLLEINQKLEIPNALR
jgi:hypothetical protein